MTIEMVECNELSQEEEQAAINQSKLLCMKTVILDGIDDNSFLHLTKEIERIPADLWAMFALSVRNDQEANECRERITNQLKHNLETLISLSKELIAIKKLKGDSSSH